MLFPGTRVERTNLVVGVIACLAGVAGTALAFFIYFRPAAQPPAPVPTQAVSMVDERLRAQSLRTAAISFRAISADYVVPQKSREWQAAEANFQKAEVLYSKRNYAEAVTYFDEAGRSFNDIYVGAQAKDSPWRSGVIVNDEKLKAYIAEIDKQIAALEKQKIRSSPLEGGVSENAATREIDEQLRNLRSVKTDAQHELIIVIGKN